MMNIKRTLLISTPEIGDKLIESFKNDCVNNYGQRHAELLMENTALLRIHDDLKLSLKALNVEPDSVNNSDKWNTTLIWQSFLNKEKEIKELFCEKAFTALNSPQSDSALSSIPEVSINDSINILVILPVYKPATSVFLPFVIKKIFIDLGTADYEYNILGLLPELEENIDEKYYPRFYACISECEKILSENHDLINSFMLLSGTNDKNRNLGKLNNIFPALQEYFKMSFFNDLITLDSLKNYRGKHSFFSSWGFSIYTFKKDRFKKHFENSLSIKAIDELLSVFEKPVERDLFFTELQQLVGKLKWTDKHSLLEDGEGYVTFSKQRQISSFQFKEKTKDDLYKHLLDARDVHEKTNEGYYRKCYLPMLFENLAQQSKETKKIIHEKIKEYLNGGLEGVKKAYALTYALLGKDESRIFKGIAAIDPLNLRTAREEIAEFYKKYLPEDERISLKDIKNKEKEIKTKQEEADSITRKIEKLEIDLFGKTEEEVEIIEKKGKLYFTIDGKNVHISGAKDMDGPIPETINTYTPTATESLPSVVDLRKFMTTVENQQSVGSCTANALVGAYEYLVKRGTEKEKDFSRLFVYYNGRAKNNGNKIEDNGSSISYCIESMMDLGVCLEKTWDYKIDNVNTKPNVNAFKEAKSYKVYESAYFDTDLVLMKRCLAEGFPFVFGIKLYKSFQKAYSKGIVPLPDKNDTSLDKHGSHAMLCVGYSEENKCFVVRNSWGSNWGDNGYCYIPYEYLANKEYRSSDYNFLLKKISDININEKELVQHISRESGTLFSTGLDVHDLNAFKERKDDIKNALVTLIPELDELRKAFTRQREEVLSRNFRSDAEENDVSKNQEEEKEKVEEVEKVDKELTKLENIKNKLLEKKKRLKIFLLYIYPAIGLSIISLFLIASVFIWSGLDVVKFLFSNYKIIPTVVLIGIVVYVIWALIRFKRKVINKLNEVQSEISLLYTKRNRLIDNLIAVFDRYFEIRREHKLFDFFYNFINQANEFVESLRVFFDKWIESISEQKLKLLKELPEDEFADSHNFFNAVTNESLLQLINKENVFNDFYQNGSKSMSEFFYNNNELLPVEDGTEIFIQKIIEATKKGQTYFLIQSFDIYDFLFGNKFLLGIFDDLPKPNFKNKLKVLIERSSPFIKTNITTDSIPSNELFKIQLPKNENKNEYVELIKEIKKKINPFTETDNSNTSSSSIVLFVVKSGLPAFAIDQVQKSYKKFVLLSNKEKNEIFIKDYINESCIPDELKYIYK